MTPFIERNDGFLYEQIATTVSKMIESETLTPGDQLPSVRELSRSRDVSVSTVVHAYRLLEDRGLVEARPKSGFYVRAIETSHITEPSITRPPRYDCEVTCQDLVMRLVSTLSAPDVVRLGAALPDADLLPTDELGRHLARVARESDHQSLAYDPIGDPSLRRSIAQRGLLSGCSFDASDLIITNGCMEALSLCLQAITEPGDTVAVESPSYFGILLLLEKLGLRALELPTSPRTGPCLEGVADVLAHDDIDAMLLIPSFNNPLGSLMPESHRRKLYALLCQYDVPLIEDDIYGDLFFGAARPKPVKAFDVEGRVLYCSSVSKTIAPGYRIGYTSPGRYGNDVASLKMAHTTSTAVPVQRAIASYLDQGGHEKRLRSLRRHYQDTLARMRDAVARSFPTGTCVTHPQGGFLLWVEMPGDIDAMEVCNRAYEAGISVAPGVLFSASCSYCNCLRLNGGVRWSDRVDDALATLGRLARDCRVRVT